MLGGAALAAAQVDTQGLVTELCSGDGCGEGNRTFDVPGNSVRVFSANVEKLPDFPLCPLKCPASGVVACSGTCPSGCKCTDGWGLYLQPHLFPNTDAGALAFSLSKKKPSSAGELKKAYTAFAKGSWEVKPFVTLYEHTEEKMNSRKHKSVAEVFGMVDLCKKSGSVVLRDNVTCNCDDCAHHCGLKQSRKLDSCDSSVTSDFRGCTYYAAGNKMHSEAMAQDFCCSAVPSEYEKLTEAVAQPARERLDNWKVLPKVQFPVWAQACKSAAADTSNYAVNKMPYSVCKKDEMKIGLYYLYVVNIAPAPQKVLLGEVKVSSLSASEAKECFYENDTSGGALRKPSTLVAAMAALMLLMSRE